VEEFGVAAGGGVWVAAGVTAGSIDSMLALRGAAGICLDNRAGLSIQLGFDGSGVLQDIWDSPAAHGETLGIGSGQPRSDVLQHLPNAMLKDPTLRATNCLIGALKPRNVDLRNPTPQDLEYLAQFDAWAYREPNSHSRVKLIFLNGRLVQIRYYRRVAEET
jgi:hypothetical protein